MGNFSWQLAHDLWTEIIDGFLVRGGRCATLRQGETPTQLVGAYLIGRLTRHKPYWHGLLAPDIHARRRGGSHYDDHVLAEADVYVQTLLRRVTLTNQKSVDRKTGQVVKERPDLTNTHTFLLLSLRFCSDRPDWRQARLVRIDGGAETVLGDDVAFHRTATALGRLYTAEQRRHQQARADGRDWGFGPSSASPSWIKPAIDADGRPTGHHLHLVIGDMRVPVPEELGFADVLDCLPDSMDRALIDDHRAGAALVRDHCGGDTDPAPSAVRKAEERLGAALPPGYRVFMLFRSLIEDLNDPYGAMVAAGIPSSAMFELEDGFRQRLSFGECGFLKRLRQQAFALARRRAEAACGIVAGEGRRLAAPPVAADTVEDWLARNEVARLPPGVALTVTENDWADAWMILEDGQMTGRYARTEFGGFDGFRQSPEGMALLNITEAPLVDDEDDDPDHGRTQGAFVLPEVEHDDIRRQLGQWARDRTMTTCEVHLADALCGSGTALYRPFSDQAFLAEIAPLEDREIPYTLLAPGTARHEILRFFFQRRFCLLRGLGCRRDGKGWKPVWFDQGDVAMTEAEQTVLRIVRAMNDQAGNPIREDSRLLQTEILGRLRQDHGLTRLLGRFPYGLAPEPSRLKLMLFFYTRDVEGSLARSV